MQFDLDEAHGPKAFSTLATSSDWGVSRSVVIHTLRLASPTARLVHLKNLRGLRDLRIDCPTRLSGESMLQLCDLKNLEVVSLSFAPNTISDMKWLKPMA